MHRFIPLIIAVTIAAAWAVHARNTSKNYEKLAQRAKSLHAQIMADREYYTSVVAPRVIDLGGGELFAGSPTLFFPQSIHFSLRIIRTTSS